MPELTIRAGTPDDAYTSFLLFEESFADLWRRLGNTEPTSYGDPEAMARIWTERRPLYEHIVATADQFWLAERNGVPVGFARAVVRGEPRVRILTEFFVAPGGQSSGAGKGLLARAMPAEEGVRRLIIASPDVRALGLYLRLGLRQRTSLYYLYRAPEARAFKTDLEVVSLEDSPGARQHLDALDRAVLGFARPQDHAFLLADRPGFLYLRGGRAAGYGYAGQRAGPFALLDPADLPAVLAHAETLAAQAGRGHFGLEVPLANHAALDTLLARGFHIEPFAAQLLADETGGQWDRYIATSPPFLP